MNSLQDLATSEKNQLSDAEVVERILEGEKELFELLMRRYNQKLYRLIRTYLPQERKVEDAMQDTYLKAYEKLHQFRHEARFSTWLIRIGINTALEKVRRNKRLATLSGPDMPYDTRYISQIPEPARMNPEKIAIQQEEKLMLERAIDSIPEKYRIIYTLREIEGMDIQEVSQCLEISESNVKVRLHRAKGLLKESLYKQFSSQEVFEFGFKRCDALVERVMQTLPKG